MQIHTTRLAQHILCLTQAVRVQKSKGFKDTNQTKRPGLQPASRAARRERVSGASAKAGRAMGDIFHLVGVVDLQLDNDMNPPSNPFIRIIFHWWHTRLQRRLCSATLVS
jgi:hypothetical protein